MRIVLGVRTVRVLVAAVTLSSGVITAAFGCATGGTNEIIFGNDASDIGILHVDSGHDTGVHKMDAGKDVGIDQFVGPTDTGVDAVIGDTGNGSDVFFSVDVGPSFFAEAGAPCTTSGAQQVESCGRCGLSTSTCVSVGDASVHHDAGPDAGDAGVSEFVWGPFGACAGQIDGGCVPGTSTPQPCGFCGTQNMVCEPDCELGTTGCTGEGVCAPGTINFVPVLNCNDAGFGGSSSTCKATCEYPDATPPCEVAPSTLTISLVPANGASPPASKVQTFVNFTTTVADERDSLALMDFGGTCPTTISTPLAPVGFVTLKNPSTTTTETVSVWTSQVTGQPSMDVGITSYTTLPLTNAELKTNCAPTIQDGVDQFGTCSDTTDPTSCLASYGGLMNADGNGITIPPSSSVVIFVQNEYQSCMMNVGFDCVGAATGVIQVTVRTE
jgi:hypothetical protein